MHQPVAKYLSETTGENVRFEYSENWPTYLRNMQRAKYDFLLDSPHFVSWRVEKIEHSPLMSMSDSMTYVVVVREEDGYESVFDLKGKTACSSSIPDLDALTLLDQYDSSWSQPVIQVKQGFKNKYTDILTGKCDSVVLVKRIYEKLSKNEYPRRTKILFESQQLPHYGFSASPRVSVEMREKIKEALISQNGDIAFSNLSQLFGLLPADRVPANEDDYRGYSYLLDDFWGF